MEQAVDGFFHGQLGDLSRFFLRRFRLRVLSGATPPTSLIPFSPRRSKSGMTEYSPSSIRLTTRTKLATANRCRDRGCQSFFGGRTDFGKMLLGMIAPIL